MITKILRLIAIIANRIHPHIPSRSRFQGVSWQMEFRF
jgi:hypothetical protein